MSSDATPAEMAVAILVLDGREAGDGMQDPTNAAGFIDRERKRDPESDLVAYAWHLVELRQRERRMPPVRLVRS